jgi:peptide/nickel transport system substrate-binding protein
MESTLMNRFRSLVALALLGAMVAGCSQTQPPAAGPGGRNPWTIPGTLRLGESDEPDGLNPMFANNDASLLADGMIYSYILRIDGDGNYVPDLATSVPTLANGGISPDQKTITLHLRKNAKWSDGTPLTAADWLFTYHSVFNSNNNVKSQYGWSAISSATAPDPYTLVIKLKEPTVAVLGILGPGGSGFPPLPEHLLRSYPDLNSVPFNDAPLSSGPYILTAWNHGSSLEFAPNPYYFRGKPKLQKVIWKVIPDAATLFNALRTHDVDVLAEVDENSIPDLNQVTGIKVTKRLVSNWRRLQFNTSRPILHDPRVRLAIAEAIDWKSINDTVYHGYNQLATSDVFPQSWAAPSIPRYKYDVDDAKALLKAAGWTQGSNGVLQNAAGTPLSLTLMTGTNKPENEKAEVFFQSMLKDVGFDIQIRNYPVNQLFAPKGPLYTGEYDMEWTQATNGADPDNAGYWAGSYIPPHGGDTSWLDDPIVNQTSAAAAQTFDQAVRKKLYQKEETRLHELVPAVIFYWQTQYSATNTDVKNYKPAAFILDSWNSWEWSV